MKPATSSKKRAILAGTLVGAFGFYWYFVPFPWLGAIMGVLTGFFTFYILSARRMERLRRAFFIGLFALVLVSLIVIIVDMGMDTFMSWVEIHEKEYYLPGQTTGALSYPCTRELPQVLLGRANYLTGFGMWETVFPSNLGEFLVLMGPFVLTGLIFGRGFCGWICPFGGLTEAFVTGRKERWKMTMFKKQVTTESGFQYAGLREWVKDTRYGILLGLVLLSIAFAFPLVCIFCPVLWLESIPIFGVVIAVLLIFAVALPFMTKRRWWCLICPMGAVLSLLNRISFFRIRIDKNKCSKCLDCVQECRMYAMTPQDVEKGECISINCVRCGRCIEACPEEAIDIYWLGTSIRVRSWFISLAVVAALAWYIWFLVILADIF